MTTKIVHFSDTHGKYTMLPHADIYVCTGDFLRNYSYPTNPEKEVLCQDKNWHNHRDYMTNREAPVVVVRGNHDFINLAKFFPGEVYECGVSPTYFNVGGIRFGGFRGIPMISWTWQDEMIYADFKNLWDSLDIENVDVIVSHATPPASYITKLGYMGIEGKVFLHGHMHEFGGDIVEIGGNKIVNSATTFSVVEF